jgi:hypothetical protein
MIKKIILFGILAIMFSSAIASGTKANDPYTLKKALQELGFQSELQPPKYLPRSEAKLEGNAGDITIFLQKLTNGITGIAAAIAVLFLIQNSFSLVIATGNSDNISKAKKGIIWSLVGLVLIMGAFIVVKTVISITYSGEEVAYSPTKMQHNNSKQLATLFPKNTVTLSPEIRFNEAILHGRS